MGVKKLQDTASVSGTTTAAADPIRLELDRLRRRVDVVVDTTGPATLSVRVSRSGEFAGEETTVREIEYADATTELEAFDFTFSFVEVELNQNVGELTAESRGV